MIALLTSLEEQLGPDSRFVHIGLTTNDVWDTATALQLRDAADLLIAGQERLRTALATLARRHRDTLTVARTHGVHAEPTTLRPQGGRAGTWRPGAISSGCAGRARRSRWASSRARSATSLTWSRRSRRRSAATSGSASSRSRPRSCSAIATPSSSARWRIAGASLEKIALEVRGLQRTEVLEAQEPFGEGQKGSSAMPHKRNPELAERICGLARLLRTNALAAVENVALWHERDISHSSVERVILPDSTILLDYLLDLTTFIVEGLDVDPARMAENLDLSQGNIYSQRVLLEADRVGTGAPGGLRAGAAPRHAGVEGAPAAARAPGRRSRRHRAAGPGRSEGLLRSGLVRAQRRGRLPAGRSSVKVRVLIRLKPGIMDVQGAAVQRALGGLGFADARGLRVGKLIELDVDAATPAQARNRVDEMCRRLLANTILEDYAIDVRRPSALPRPAGPVR